MCLSLVVPLIGRSQDRAADHVVFTGDSTFFLPDEGPIRTFFLNPVGPPKPGCPDPLEIPLAKAVSLVRINTAWWLHPDQGTSEPDSTCNCFTKQDVVNKLREILYKNRYKTVLLITEHPIYGDGKTGRFLRKIFAPVDDRNHPLYKEMVRSLESVVQDFPNVICISGHEKGQELIISPENKRLQLVSGIGNKHPSPITAKNALYANTGKGYIMADLLAPDSIRFRFMAGTGHFTEVFHYTWHRLPYLEGAVKAGAALFGDSVRAAAHPAYMHGSFYRFFMGNNYRREWADTVRLPVIQISRMLGGLTPTQLGGGLQSTSLRLVDANGKEYALRSVEKKPDLIVPKPFEGTVVKDVLDDVISSQHPYTALVVPPIAQAAGIPHATPFIGVVAHDTALGMFEPLFVGKVALLENREPLGKSDNYEKTLKNLQKDHDNSYDARSFLKARMVDLFLDDWDRHGDQWRFFDENRKTKGADSYYLAVPRDRDMVFYVTQGFFPVIVKRLLAWPRVYGFGPDITKGVHDYLYKSAFLNAHPASQLAYGDWMKAADEFRNALTDTVLEQSLKGLPPEIYPLRHDEQLAMLKSRRDGLPKAMDKYYRFVNQIVDIRASDKAELLKINSLPDSDALRVTMRKKTKKGQVGDTIMDKVYPKKLTREIRLYLGEGDDSVSINNPDSHIKIRIIGDKGDKRYTVLAARKKVELYDRKENRYDDPAGRLQKHLSKEKSNTAFDPVNLYNTAIPLLNVAYNPDDGVYLGAGFRYTRQKGFRKTPYASLHQLMISHVFGTAAFNVTYTGEWIHAIGNMDITASALIRAPDNSQNFFGRGNETPFDKADGYARYYRIRFDLLQFDGALRWKGNQHWTLSVGPSLQLYHMKAEDNEGRFINQTSMIHGYDSTLMAKDKMHAGLVMNYQLDHRSSPILPTWGNYLRIKVQAYAALNSYSRNFAQVFSQFAFYKSLDKQERIIFSDRLGGGLTLGQTAFYQSVFLGSEGNLMGYRKYRFAGQHAAFNNAELRWNASDFGNYIVKGQIGLFGFYDVGRVWQQGESSDKWHNGVGAGVYISPASLAILRFSYGHSSEGWYPNFAMGWRF
ncbi:Surface antigen [bacterium A37T11]|nr:Surface antigen [bacterium A37T11]